MTCARISSGSCAEISAISTASGPASDREWLATRVGTFGAGHPLEELAAFPAGVVVEPLDVPSAVSLVDEQLADSAAVIALVGWPTGRHHSLVKAAEARLAGEMGATEIWLALPVSGSFDDSALLSDMIAVAQAVPEDVRFGVIVPDQHVAPLADQAGAAVIAVDAASGIVPAASAEIAVFGQVPDIDATIEWISQGATRVFALNPEQALR